MIIDLLHGDCLERLKELPDGYIDMVLCDPPYGVTRNKWDSIIPLDLMWKELNRVVKPGGAVVMHAAQPFTSILVTSNLKDFKYTWVWRKNRVTGHLSTRIRPLREHEDICVFSRGKPPYNAQGLTPYGKVKYRGADSENYGPTKAPYSFQEYTNWPKTILNFDAEYKNFHPTQKPVQLTEYLIKTYSSPGDIVLDFAMGSGTVGVACVNTGRGFVGIEINDKYFTLASNRVDECIDLNRRVVGL